MSNFEDKQYISAVLSSLKSQAKTILITGHTGFKGAWLTLLLKEYGFTVVGVSLPAEAGSLYSTFNASPADREYFCDIRDRNQLLDIFKVTNPGVVIHLAAQALVVASYKDPVGTFEVNVQGTVNVLHAATEVSSVKTVLVATTDKVYENKNTGKRFVESDPLSGRDPYSASKVAVEAVCLAWQHLRDTVSGPKILVARAGNVIGGGDLSPNRLVPDIIRSHKNQGEMTVRNINATRPWQHVLDPLMGYLQFIDRSLEEELPAQMNFGPSEGSYSVRELLEIAARRIDFSWKEEGSDYIEAQTLDLDSTQAQSRLKWFPKWSQDEAIHHTLDWWISHLKGQKSALNCCLEDVNQFLGRG